MTQLPDRILPQSSEAERGTICSRLLSPIEFGAMCESRGVTRDWFHIPANAELYGAIETLHRENRPLDFVTIGQYLRDKGTLESVGGAAAVSAAFFYVPTAANAGDYLDILTEKHLRRKIISIATKQATAAYDEGEPIAELLSNLHADVTGLLHRKSYRATIRDEIRSILEEIATGQPDATLLPTGMEGVDGRLSLYRGDLLMITAPTSCGKSALAFNIAMNVALRGKRVGLYPLEMRQKQSLKRSLAQLSGYNAEFVRKLTLQAASGTDAQRAAAKRAQDEFVAAAGTVLSMKLHMRDDIHRIEAILADIRAETAREPFDFIVIDYLQLIQSDRRFERRQLEIAAITQRLKALANELDCVICVPSQVNKDGGTREAQDAENDASALIKINADENDNGDICPGRVEVWKQREGARHIDLPLKFNGLLTRFEYKA